MKRIGIIISILALSIAACSCSRAITEPDGMDTGKGDYYTANKNAKTYFATTVKYGQAQFGYEFLYDGGYNLIPYNTLPGYSPAEGKRVILTGVIIDALKGTDKDSIIYINSIQDVLTKEVVNLKASGENSSVYPKDPITPESAWLGGGYINIYFTVEGTNTVEHSIDLIYDPDNQKELNSDTIRLVLVHNANGDGKTNKLNGIVSFKNPFGDAAKSFVIEAKTLSDGVKDFQVDLTKPDYLNF